MAQTKKELQIMTPDKAGMLEEVTAVAAGAGANIEALCAYGMQGKATFLLVTTDNNAVKAAASKKGWEVEEHDVAVVTIPDKVGTANELGKKLKTKNVNLLYCYVTSGGAGTCTLVLRGDNAAAVAAAV